ncbi:MAG: hypothetical protein AAGE13_04200 [Pseudomonadota bacterium]
MTDITKQDLVAAVETGILNADQAGKIEALAQSRAGLRKNIDDEPFEFFNGFSQIFMTLGIVLFFGGALFVGPIGSSVMFNFILIGIAFVLAEFIVRERRMQLPGIALGCVLAAFALRSDTLYLVHVSVPPLIAALLLMVFYLRHHVPAALFGFGALILIALLLPFLENTDPIQRDVWAVFDLGRNSETALITLAVGLVAFTAAMWFDLRDPHRVSRLSACGFWLHLLAAPTIVNTLAFTAYELGGVAGYALLTIAILFFVVVALVIDRRSFLTAALAYLGLVLAMLLDQLGGISTALVICLLGMLVIGVAAGWRWMRAGLLARLRWLPWYDRLPPVEIRA